MINDFTLSMIDRKLNLRSGSAKSVLEELLNRKLISYLKGKIDTKLSDELNDLWITINPSRVSAPNMIARALEEYKKTYGDITNNDIIKAAKKYLDTIEQKQFVRSVANFIYHSTNQDSLLHIYRKSSTSKQTTSFDVDL